MNLLITGATGFVGRNYLLEQIQNRHYDKIFLTVRNLLKLKEQLAFEGINEIPGWVIPIQTEAPQWKLPKETFNHVVHMAGILSSLKESDYFDVHVAGTRSLLPQLTATEKIVILSSATAAGPCQREENEKTELSLTNPVTIYGKSKLQMEQSLKEQFSNLPITILRPPMVLGARDTATLPLFQMAKFPIRLKPGTAEKFYSFIGVSDLTSAIDKALVSPSGLYFVNHPRIITDRELIGTAALVLGKIGITLGIPQFMIGGVGKLIHRSQTLSTRIPNLSKNRIAELWPNRWVASAQAFERAAGWKATVELQPALTSAAEWYKKMALL